MIAILHEFFTQIVTALIMGGVIVLGVFTGHKARDFMDARKEKKNQSEGE
ncbi:MAG: hypothetical protein IJM76_07155 [Lachnospiraceae bacterium]|nr:hypothetical protein [Lachnospiraceae bacterium]